MWTNWLSHYVWDVGIIRVRVSVSLRTVIVVRKLLWRQERNLTSSIGAVYLAAFGMPSTLVRIQPIRPLTFTIVVLEENMVLVIMLSVNGKNFMKITKSDILCDIQIGKDLGFEPSVVYPNCWFEPNSHNKGWLQQYILSNF